MHSVVDNVSWIEALSPWPEEFGLGRMRRLLAELWARGATIPLPREPLRGPVPAVY